MFQAQLSDVEYRLPLGAIKKVNAAIVIERETVLRGSVRRTTYEFERNTSANAAWLMLVDALQQNKKTLYSCDGLSCGSSNSWANDVFFIKQLYGLDQTQKYRAFVLIDKPSTFLSVYFVQRGNKRIYAQVDEITTSGNLQYIPPSASTISKELLEKGYYSLPVIEDTGGTVFDKEELSALLSAMKSSPLSKYFLVGHAYSESELNANLERSKQYAQALNDHLLSNRQSRARFEVHALGNLAPDQAVPVDRVTVVLK